MGLDSFREQVVARYTVEAERGEHDSQCEFRPEGFWLCHCSKRAREAQGYTEPPGELIWKAPDCPRCWREVEFDGDVWSCHTCRCRWDTDGRDAEFDDDFGDLTADLAAWEAKRGGQ